MKHSEAMEEEGGNNVYVKVPDFALPQRCTTQRCRHSSGCCYSDKASSSSSGLAAAAAVGLTMPQEAENQDRVLLVSSARPRNVGESLKRTSEQCTRRRPLRLPGAAAAASTSSSALLLLILFLVGSLHSAAGHAYVGNYGEFLATNI